MARGAASRASHLLSMRRGRALSRGATAAPRARQVSPPDDPAAAATLRYDLIVDERDVERLGLSSAVRGWCRGRGRTGSLERGG
jgi:hypothetical protein